MRNFLVARVSLNIATVFLLAGCINPGYTNAQLSKSTVEQSSAIQSALAGLTVDYDENAETTLSSDEKKIIQRIAATTYGEVREILPALTGALTIEIRVESVYQASGDGGYAMSPTRVRWIVDPSKGNVTDIARSDMRQTLYHEMHHLVRGWTVEDGKPKTSFMDGVVAEGLAVAFERDFAGATPPTADYPADVADWVEELKALPVDADYRKWM